MADLRTTRRRLLLGFAAASTAVVAPAIGAVPEAENPELLALGDEAAEAVAGGGAGEAHYYDILREGQRRWPKTPEELFLKDADGNYLFGSGPWGGYEIERDFAGGGFCRKGEKVARRVVGRSAANGPYAQAYDALSNKRLLRTGKLYGRSLASWKRQLAETKPLSDIAEAYYGECERIREELAWDATWRAYDAKVKDLGDLVTKIMRTEARTMEGVVIKGQVLSGWGQVNVWHRGFGILEMGDWGPLFAADVMRIAALKGG